MSHSLHLLPNFSSPDAAASAGSDTESGAYLALTPEALSALLKVAGPDQPVTLKGVASEVYAYPKGSVPKGYYGRLGLGGASVRFRVSAESAPANGEACVIHGALTVRPIGAGDRDGGQWKATHEVLLVGAKVGTWQPAKPANLEAEAVHALRRDDTRTPLASWVARSGTRSLLVIASSGVAADFLVGLDKEKSGVALTVVRGRFDEADAFLDVFHGIDWTGVEAVAVVRGGGGGIDAVGNSPRVVQALIELDKPFYAALGHTDSVCLIDKFADESFVVPHAFGAALADAVADAAARRQQEEKWQRGQADLQRMRAEVNAARAAQQPVSAPAPPVAQQREKPKPLDYLFVVPITPKVLAGAALVLFIVFLWGRYGG
ncbi:MAG: hypothetical protein JNN30_05445 [Rhodanobacteraceae bacterium]|nr:hypothetical protein [Rhodanobacteraceae bacterium]